MSVNNSSSFIRPEEFWRRLGLQAGQRVVHLGSGAGFYLIPAAKIVGQSGSVIGVDVMTHLLSESENRAQREQVAGVIHTVRADLEKNQGSTLPAGNADWVLVANILHQSDPAKILTEAKRLIKPNGRVVVVVWDVVATPLGPPAGQRFSKETMLSIAQTVGLSLVKDFAPSPYHYSLVLKVTGKSAE
ncbi:MAG: methyltransferase domain-containing protein [bacterium]|nr:methyltransferase domain-containing protein [bacterium]